MGMGRGWMEWTAQAGRHNLSNSLTRTPCTHTPATRPAPRDVTPADVASAAAAGSCWAALRGKVYDLGPYLRFHPGGAALLEAAAGTDCTAAFNEAHAWVNGDALLVSCLIGPLKAGAGAAGDGSGGGRGGAGGGGALPQAPSASSS
jgi:cytochrome b involved in lipid metabolism